MIHGKGDARKLHKMSQREAKWITKMLATGSTELAGAEIGIDAEASKRFGKRKAVQSYLHDLLTQRALASGLTLDKLMAKLNLAIDGEVVLSDPQMDAIKTAAKILRPASIGVQVNTFTQNNGVATGGPSPYADMSMEKLLEQIKDTVGDLRA